jgi:serine/threonine protein kinase
VLGLVMDEVTTGDFVVGQVLGEGRFATVFHARLKEATRKAGPQNRNPESSYVAIKVIEKTTLGRNEGILSAVLQEQRLLRRLTEGRVVSPLRSPSTGESSQNDSESSYEGPLSPSFVVPLLASFHDDQFVYMVMECARGTVGDAIREHAKHRAVAANDDTPPSSDLSSHDWVRIAAGLSYQTVQALECIHTHSVVHCDVKPDNLLLGVGGRVQLCDFGSAIELRCPESHMMNPGGAGAGAGTGESRRTATVPRGTSEYASPELLRGLDCVSYETDLWSLGCVMYALLHGGESPFRAPSDSLAVQKVMNFNSSAAKEISSSLPLEWRAAVRGFLESEPSLRWAKPIELGGSHQCITEECPHKSSLQERYGILKQLPLWTGMDVAEPLLDDLLSSPKWSSERLEDMRDGNLGWTAFA